MNLSYVQGQSVEYGELKPVIMTGSGPVSYSQTTGDLASNPAPGDYLAYLDGATTKSGNYTLVAVPTAVNQFRAGAPSPSQSGWRFIWYNTVGFTQVANATNLSAEVIQVMGLVTQL
jgi:hypothetical protein